MLELGPDDGPRLLSFLTRRGSPADAKGEDGRVTREMFVVGVGKLIHVSENIRRVGLTLETIKHVLISVFERIDVDKDGELSEEEFAAGLQLIGLDLEEEDSTCLHGFFAAQRRAIAPESLAPETSAWELLALLQRGSLGMAQERLRWTSLVRLFEAAGETLAAAPHEWAERAVAATVEVAEALSDLAEGAVDLAGLAVATQALLRELGSGGAEGVDEQVAPFALLVTAFLMKFGKDVSELAPRNMSEDEALLYWGVFHKHGFSQASFGRLVSCEGCSWGIAEAGEVLSGVQDRRLRVLVRGAAELRRPGAAAGQAAARLPPGATVGEAAFLGGDAPPQSGEVVVATERVVYVSWDFASLREVLSHDSEAAACATGLLSRSMLANFKLDDTLRGERSPVAARQRELSCREHFNKVFASLDLDSDGVILREELLASPAFVESLLERMGLPSSDAELDRLFAFFAGPGASAAPRGRFAERLARLEECIQGLREGDMSIGDLRTVYARAHCQIDTDGDGFISLDELRAALRRLGMPLDERQSETVHAYFDHDGDGLVAPHEWQEQAEAPVFAALIDTVGAHAQKKGLSSSAHVLRRALLALQGPEAPRERVAAALAVLWDGSEPLGEAAGWCVDVCGFAVSLAGIIGSSSSLGDDDSLLLPVLFLAAFSAQTWQNFSGEKVSDLQEREALLFAKAFEGAGVSVAEFRALLRHGAPRWHSLAAGEAVIAADTAAKTTLCTVVSGRCQVQGRSLGAMGKVGSGGFLSNLDMGQDDMDEQESSLAARALKPTTAVMWDWDALRPYLERNKELKMKLHRAIATSMANSLLDARMLDGCQLGV